MNYRCHPAISGTDARLMVKDFEAWAFNRRLKLNNEVPVWLVDEPSEAMQFGTAVHMALLEPEEFRRKAVIMPYVESFAVKAGREIKMDALERAMALDGGFVLRQEHAWAIEQIAINFAPVRAQFEGPWFTEVQTFGAYKGYATKGTVDAFTNECLVDLKTTRDVTRISETIASERYNIQIAHYLHLMPAASAAYIFIENTPPFRVVPLRMTEQEVEMAVTAWGMAMDRAIDDGLAVKSERI